MPDASRLRAEAAADSGPMTVREEVWPQLRTGRYRTEEVIGRGGMAIVHLARRAGALATAERFAVKRILPEFARSSAFVRMFCREARLGKQLDHPNVVRVRDFGEQDGELLLVTEYVDGTSCGRLLSRLSRNRGEGESRSFPLPVALHIVCEVLEALAHTHAVARTDGTPLGVIHRDVSPGNILIGAMGEVKLSDFGVAHSSDDNHDTRPGALKGKMGYMSPEQATGLELDCRSDLFSLGVVAFEMLTGKPFFTGRDDFEMLAKMHEGALSPLSDPRATGLPFELRLVLATALARERAERFWDAAEFSAALHSFARHAGIRLERRALVSWLRSQEIWPGRSGTYPAVRTDALAAALAPTEPGGGSDWRDRGQLPRGLGG